MIPATPTLNDLFANTQAATDPNKKALAIFTYATALPKEGSENLEQIRQVLTVLGDDDLLFHDDEDVRNPAHGALGFFAMNVDNHATIKEIIGINKSIKLAFMDANMPVKTNALRTLMQLSKNSENHADIIKFLGEKKLKMLLDFSSNDDVNLKYAALLVLAELVKNQAMHNMLITAFAGVDKLIDWMSARTQSWEMEPAIKIYSSLILNPNYQNQARACFGIPVPSITAEAKKARSDESSISEARLLAASFGEGLKVNTFDWSSEQDLYTSSTFGFGSAK